MSPYSTAFLCHSAETTVKPSRRAIFSMAKSPNESLRQSILEGAAVKLERKSESDIAFVDNAAERILTESGLTKDTIEIPKNYTYFIREACRPGEDLH